MIRIISFNERQLWDSTVNSFSDKDVYYLSGFVAAFYLNGDGRPELFYFESETNRAICVMMRRTISNDAGSDDFGEYTGWYDYSIPYGYGGVMFDTPPSETDIKEFNRQFSESLSEQRIVSAFFRFHPVLNNAEHHRTLLEVVDLGKTIALDLSSPEVIWQNITSKNRNMIRKAEKSGVVIRHGKGMQLLDTFKKIYDDTMRHDNADGYYFFDKEFYASIDRDLNDNYEVFYAEYEGRIIAMSIIIFAGNQMHYHLSGSIFDYRNLAPSNLLLYKAALWGHKKGFATFHLGGGVGSGEDNLYKFKAAFNRNSDCRFSIGRMIVNREKYNELVALRHFSADRLEGISFFPKYRAID